MIQNIKCDIRELLLNYTLAVVYVLTIYVRKKLATIKTGQKIDKFAVISNRIIALSQDNTQNSFALLLLFIIIIVSIIHREILPNNSDIYGQI